MLTLFFAFRDSFAAPHRILEAGVTQRLKGPSVTSFTGSELCFDACSEGTFGRVPLLASLEPSPDPPEFPWSGAVPKGSFLGSSK